MNKQQIEERFQAEKAFWTEQAREHGAINYPPTQFEDDELNKRVATDVLHRFPKDQLAEATVLDYGCGEGRLIPYIAPQVGKYIGIDAASTALAFAEKVAADFPNVELYELRHSYSLNADTRQQLKDVNLVFSWTVFQHMPHEVLQFALRKVSNGLSAGARIHTQIDFPPMFDDRPRLEKHRYDKDQSLGACRWWPSDVLSEMFKSVGLDVYELPSRLYECWRVIKR